MIENISFYIFILILIKLISFIKYIFILIIIIIKTTSNNEAQIHNTSAGVIYR